MKNKKTVWVIVIVAAVLAIAGGVFWKTKNGKGPGKAGSVELVEQQVTNGTISALVTASASVAPQNRVEVKPTIGGRVEQILVHEGDKVKSGQILAWISSSERAALLDAAKGLGDKEMEYWKEVYKPASLVSPIDGEVIVRALEPGQTVAGNTAVLVVSDRLIVRARFDETDIGKVAREMKVIIKLDAYPDVKISGAISHILYESKLVNNVTTYEVEIIPEQIPPEFRSGMNCEVDVVYQRKENVPIIPVEAIERDSKGSYVRTDSKKDDESARKYITTGVTDGDRVEVSNGLAAGDVYFMKRTVFSKDLLQAKAVTNPFMPTPKKQTNSTSSRRPPGAGGPRH